MTKKYIDELTYTIIGAAIEVHKSLCPGLLESVYHKCLKQEFMLRSLNFGSEFIVPVEYKGIHVETDLRCDFLVEEAIVVELKAVEQMYALWEAQILSYLRLTKLHIGFLINFNVPLIKQGIRRYRI